MINIAVVEDEKVFAEQMRSYLEQYQKEKNVRFNTSFFSDGDEIAEHYSGEYDIIFMDIQMQFLDGMTAAEMIRNQDPQVILIFITSTPQYAVKGYSVGALDYVLKPINYFALSHRLDKALAGLRQRTGNYLLLTFAGGVKKVNIDSLYYVESYGHKLTYHMPGEEFVCAGTMKETEQKLESLGHFYPCSKGYLINLEYVEAVQDNSVFVHGEELPLSRKKKTDLLAVLAGYCTNIVNRTYQYMNIYVPAAYLDGGEVNGYTADTAPVVLENSCRGWNSSSPGGVNTSYIDACCQVGYFSIHNKKASGGVPRLPLASFFYS